MPDFLPACIETLTKRARPPRLAMYSNHKGERTGRARPRHAGGGGRAGASTALAVCSPPGTDTLPLRSSPTTPPHKIQDDARSGLNVLLTRFSWLASRQVPRRKARNNRSHKPSQASSSRFQPIPRNNACCSP
ncbi:unnamed protein product [Ectocarpus sp. 13 AM-2016]